MKNKKDGGPAFPEVTGDFLEGGSGEIWSIGGMSLRDYFAAKAMQGIISNFSNEIVLEAHINLADDFEMSPDEMTACSAYSLADAMLKERNK